MSENVKFTYSYPLKVWLYTLLFSSIVLSISNALSEENSIGAVMFFFLSMIATAFFSIPSFGLAYLAFYGLYELDLPKNRCKFFFILISITLMLASFMGIVDHDLSETGNLVIVSSYATGIIIGGIKAHIKRSPFTSDVK